MPDFPKAVYRVTCEQGIMLADPTIPAITQDWPFALNPGFYEDDAIQHCAQPVTVQGCINLSCEGPNYIDCMCGNTISRADTSRNPG